VRGRIIRFSSWVTEAIVAYADMAHISFAPVGLTPCGDAAEARSLPDASFIHEPVDVVLFASGYLEYRISCSSLTARWRACPRSRSADHR
jgi:hypothetical protein